MTLFNNEKHASFFQIILQYLPAEVSPKEGFCLSFDGIV